MKHEDFYKELKRVTQGNGNFIPSSFIDEQVEKATVTYVQPTKNTRICILTMETGHEVVGYARVLDSDNDDAVKGNLIAFNNAKNELWSVYGTIAKLFI